MLSALVSQVVPRPGEIEEEVEANRGRVEEKGTRDRGAQE